MAKILKNLFLFFSIAAAITCFIACEKRSYVVKGPEVSLDTVSFSGVIQPIFDAKCVSCHGGATAPDLRADNSHKALAGGNYATLPAGESALYKAIVNNFHTPFTVQAEKDSIFSWISQGAKDN
ncbi:MAG: hypothetical protein LBV26_08415 [Bacteroidales bacterium]|jgi:hypothetical protein|nr:hypothetical protein [Bacteroidales bacterium]